MNDFKIEDEHEHINYIFDSSGLAKEFARQHPNEKFSTINGKEENRIRGKCHAIENLSIQNYGYVNNAVKILCPPRNLLEVIEDQIAGRKREIIGVMFCKTCLHRSIIACEELLTTLNEIEKDLK